MTRLLSIVTLSERPDLAPVVAGWLHAEFAHARGPSLPERIAHLRAQASPEETYVLHDDGVPVATASLVASDLPTRPDLFPWLASLVVPPDRRGRGYSTPLIRHVEAAAATLAPTLWLYTWTAEPLYARLGWHRVGPERDPGRDLPVVLMRRTLR